MFVLKLKFAHISCSVKIRIAKMIHSFRIAHLPNDEQSTLWETLLIDLVMVDFLFSKLRPRTKVGDQSRSEPARVRRSMFVRIRPESRSLRPSFCVLQQYVSQENAINWKASGKRFCIRLPLSAGRESSIAVAISHKALTWNFQRFDSKLRN